MKVIGYQQHIKDILFISKESRNSDFNLMYMLMQRIGEEPNKLTVTKFLKGMKEGIYPHFETVRRTRQLLQEKHIELRGTNYQERQDHGRNTRQTIIHES